MPLALQVKLLRVLQEKQVRPAGTTKSVSIDVRILSATHRSLEAEMQKGNFREDLYYRLKVVALQLPNLAAHREDIPLLATHFLEALCRQRAEARHRLCPGSPRGAGPGALARQCSTFAQRGGADGHPLHHPHYSCFAGPAGPQ